MLASKSCAGKACSLNNNAARGNTGLRAAPVRSSSSRPRLGRQVQPRALDVNLLSAIAEAGDVEAPIGLAVGIGVVVAIAGTALVPILLKPGDDAAKEVFDAKQQDPLKKKK